MRRRAEALAGEGNDIGDIAHLEAPRQYFAFCSPSQQLFSLLIRCDYFFYLSRANRSDPHPSLIAYLASAEYSAVAFLRLISARHSGGITEYVSASTLLDMLDALLRQIPH
jgi:hypothetical protein